MAPKKVKEISTDQVRTLLSQLVNDYFTNKFQLTENYKEQYEQEIAKYQLECDNLTANGQNCDKERNFLNNVKKVVQAFEKSKKALDRKKLHNKIKEDETYLYALLMNMEKDGIIEKSE